MSTAVQSVSAYELFDSVHLELAPKENDNRLVRLIAEGSAPRSVFRALAAEESRIVPSDWRCFLYLAARSECFSTREFFTELAQGEALALTKLKDLVEALGLTDDEVSKYQPMAGCQAYPSFMSWLALHGKPADALVALATNFAAFGGYCATIAKAMREHYGFDDAACGFFDFFGTPIPGMQDRIATLVQSALDSDECSEESRVYSRLFQSYELMFWNTIADDI